MSATFFANPRLRICGLADQLADLPSSETKTIQANVGVAGNHAGSNSEVHESDSYDDKPSVDEEELLELGSHGQKETLRDVKLVLGLTKILGRECLASSGWEPMTVCSSMCRGSPMLFNTKSR